MTTDSVPLLEDNLGLILIYTTRNYSKGSFKRVALRSESI